MVAAKDGSGNIFLTTENLAFAMPLILLCGSYAYFKFVPLDYGLPFLGVVGVLIFISSKMQARKDEKLQNLDEDMIDDLVGDDDDDDQAKLAKEKQAKARAQVERRLAAEQRKAEKAAKSTGKKKGKGGDDDDDDDLAAFVKGSRESKQKKR